jgi:hypothetical protein
MGLPIPQSPPAKTSSTPATTDAVPVPSPAPGPPPPSRWNYPKKLTSGVFIASGGPSDSLKRASQVFPGSGTFLYYKSIGADPQDLPDSYFAAARAKKIIPQIGFESGNLTLPDLRKALAGKGTLPETTAQGKPIAGNQALNKTYGQLVAWADHLKSQGPIIFRPLSEMNDASGAWEMGRKGNTPADYAAVWNQMHDLFEARGATNLRWTFDVLAVQGKPPPGLSKVNQALKAIPAKNIDNVGMNPYALQIGGEMESFDSLVSPWLKLFKDTGHANAPVVSEMGVSNNTAGHNAPEGKNPDQLKPGTAAYAKVDAQRAKWIHDAFAYARAHGFASVTYFTQMDTHWRVDAGSLAYKALQEEIQKD